MFRYIERLRNAPLEVRKRVAVMWTAILGGVILFLWGILSLIHSYISMSPDEREKGPREVNGIVAPY